MGIFEMADGKDLGEAGQEGRETGRVTAGEGVLFAPLRIVHITPTVGGGRRPRQMMGETRYLETILGRSGRGFAYLPLGSESALSPGVSGLSCRPYSVQSIFITGIS